MISILESCYIIIYKKRVYSFEAEDGKVAQEVLEKENIHLAIVDIMMPFVDGYTLCEEIRKYHDIPVILLTAKDQLVDKEKDLFLVQTIIS